MASFATIKSNYPTSNPCDAVDAKSKKLLFENQCAIRLSHALKKSGVSFLSFPRTRKCWVHPMKKAVFMLMGVVVGGLLAGAILFLSGNVLQAVGIQLYKSEADQ